MRTVYHAENVVDAHLVKDYLEAAGMPAFINGEYLQGAVGELPARDYISVAVPDSVEEEAKLCVKEVETMLNDARDAIDDEAFNGRGFSPSVA